MHLGWGRQAEIQILRKGERVRVGKSVWVASEESGVEMKEKFSQLVHFFRVSFQGEKMKNTLDSLNIGSKNADIMSM